MGIRFSYFNEIENNNYSLLQIEDYKDCVLSQPAKVFKTKRKNSSDNMKSSDELKAIITMLIPTWEYTFYTHNIIHTQIWLHIINWR